MYMYLSYGAVFLELSRLGTSLQNHSDDCLILSNRLSHLRASWSMYFYFIDVGAFSELFCSRLKIQPRAQIKLFHVKDKQASIGAGR